MSPISQNIDICHSVNNKTITKYFMTVPQRNIWSYHRVNKAVVDENTVYFYRMLQYDKIYGAFHTSNAVQYTKQHFIVCCIKCMYGCLSHIYNFIKY